MKNWWLNLRIRMRGLHRQVIPAERYFTLVAEDNYRVEEKRQRSMSQQMLALLRGEPALLELFEKNQPIVFEVRPGRKPPATAILAYEPVMSLKRRNDANASPAHRPYLMKHGRFRYLYQDGKLVTINQHTTNLSIVPDEPLLVYRPYWP